MLEGDPTTTSQTRGIIGGSSEETFLPADLDGIIPPPAGDPNHFVAFPSGTPLIYKIWAVPRGLHHPSELDLCRRSERRSSVIYFPLFDNSRLPGGNWMGGEAIIRLQAGPTWTGQPSDYWAPTNWLSLDNSDTDLGRVSATVDRCTWRYAFAACARARQRSQCVPLKSE